MENKGMPYQVMLDRYQQTIRELHIGKLKDRNLFDLSGGQKQTIAFASVYALNPTILSWTSLRQTWTQRPFKNYDGYFY